MCSPSATLTAWAGAWLTGAAAPDDVLDALQAWAPQHRLIADGRVAGAAELLQAVRISAGPGRRLRHVLPAPGDVRGLPAATEFAAAATEAGEGLLAGSPGEPGLGLVPGVADDRTIHWTAFEIVVPDQQPEPSLGEADRALREATREAAAALAALQRVRTGSRADDPRAHIEASLATQEMHRWPATMPARAYRVLDTADRIAAILELAAGDSGAPLSGSATATQESVLRSLAAAVRTAHVAAVHAAIRG